MKHIGLGNTWMSFFSEHSEKTELGNAVLMKELIPFLDDLSSKHRDFATIVFKRSKGFDKKKDYDFPATYRLYLRHDVLAKAYMGMANDYRRVLELDK